MDVSDEQKFAAALEILKPLDLVVDDYRSIACALESAMVQGLQLATRDEASVKMFPSFVTRFPTGQEKGEFLALDLGGTNYRVLLVTLAGAGIQPKIYERTYAVPMEHMHGSSKNLFGYIATTLSNFLERHGVKNKKMVLGFTFSFPCEQFGINKANLVRWTKGFDVKDAVNQDIAQLLQDAIDEAGLSIKCIAVVNDTVGTLASCALSDPKCAIGLIVGTGTNAAYIEKIKNVEFMREIEEKYGKTERPDSEDSVVINMEWGAFGEKGEINSILTEFDRQLDKASLHPGKQIFEKLISGMYLGELVRVILKRLVQEKLLFRGEMPEELEQPNGFHTRWITEAERDPPHLYYSTHSVLTEDIKIPIVEPIDDKIVRLACELVAKRAAFLAGAGISALLHRLNRPKVTIGIDGSLYKFHPKFRERMTDIIHQLKPDNSHFRLRLSEDGSGKGAAAIAAAASRQINPESLKSYF